MIVVVVQSLGCVWLFCDPMDCSLPGSAPRQEYWSGLPFPSPGDLTDPGIEFMISVLAGRFLSADLLVAQRVKNLSAVQETWVWLSLFFTFSTNRGQPFSTLVTILYSINFYIYKQCVYSATISWFFHL